MPKKISLEQLKEILIDPNTTEDEIKQYVEFDRNNSNRNPFKYPLKVKPGSVDTVNTTETDAGDQWLNKIARECREKQYREKLAENFNGVKIVSEGDSWFQFPFLLKDVIDYLSKSDNYAIFSLDAAGDTLENMIAKDEVSNAIRAENPQVFLISGGGNDMFANGLFPTLLNSFKADLEAEQYLNKEFDNFIEKIIDLFDELFRKLLNFPNLKIVCHGYDYIIPRETISGSFVRNSMSQKGINDDELQEKIMKVVIDRLNEAQIKLVSQPKFRDRVFHVDCRGAVNENNWFDEIHPNNDGFKSVADRFNTVIVQKQSGRSIAASANTSKLK